jgi:hypothetical protein
MALACVLSVSVAFLIYTLATMAIVQHAMPALLGSEFDKWDVGRWFEFLILALAPVIFIPFSIIAAPLLAESLFRRRSPVIRAAMAALSGAFIGLLAPSAVFVAGLPIYFFLLMSLMGY